MAINNQDKTEIHNLPEVTALQPGMMVAVDSEPTGTKSFNLTTTLEGKVDAPATTPAKGQVLTFNGSTNTWANPPGGGYVLNYTEIGSFTDIDVERMKTQPTFVRIDAEQSITIKTSLTNAITIPLEIGTMMRLVEQSTAWAVFVAEKVKYYPTGTDNASFGANACHVNILLRICKSDVSSTTKVFSCYGDIEDTSALFNESPMPCTMHYQNARGADLDTGDVFTQYTGRATAVQFNSASGKYRRNLLMPEEIQSHDFSSDTTPEQIQFMGWGATSNRAGYKNIITAQHTYDSTNFPLQTPQVQFLKTKMSGGTPESDQVMDIVQASMKSSDGQSTTTIGGILVPSISSAGVLQNWSDSNGGHYGWKPVNEVPASTSSDSGKALIVDSNGTPGWITLNGVPASTSTDTGKVLTVDASGIPGWIQPASGLPSISGQDEGKVLTVSSGIASWVTSSSNVIDCGNKTEADIIGGKVTVGAANSVTKITLTTVGALTIVANTGVPNFAYEIDNTGNSNDVTITIKYSTESGTLLCPASGKKIAAGKHVQIRAFGNCWVLYDMYVDIYNPLGLPDRTIRLKFDHALDPTGWKPGSVWTDVSGDVWDCTIDKASWNAALYGMGNLVEILGANTSTVTSMGDLFMDCTYLTRVALFDTSAVTNTSCMFLRCNRLETVATFDTSHVTDMSGMFSQCSALTTIPDLDVSSVQNVTSMCLLCGNVQTGAYNMYNKLKDIPNLSHSKCFRDCGDSDNIPTDWK